MWQIKIHRLVLQEDFKKVPPFQQKEILRTVQKKLTLDPQAYGQRLPAGRKPLRGAFAGYWRLRIGDYRVVYRMIREEIVVLVIKIGIRKDNQIYGELLSRLKKTQENI